LVHYVDSAAPKAQEICKSGHMLRASNKQVKI